MGRPSADAPRNPMIVAEPGRFEGGHLGGRGRDNRSRRKIDTPRLSSTRLLLRAFLIV